ncbi:hypothetical protein AB8A21_04425 [Streptomyces sp. BF23-18]|uniref:hypothetical protein n=1 Tax=Streptomyces sp. BF23-18 TaxID=3240282 RepID=UPI0034E41CF9
MGRGTGGSGDAGGAVDEASALLTAVRAQDMDLVRSLLRDDGEPDLLDAAFCLAVRTYSAGIAQLLLDHGADPGRRGPDELLPLRRDRRPGLADAMAALLDDAERQVQIAAVHGLALHEDERCVPASHRLGPPRRGVLTEEHCLEAAWRYEWRREGPELPDPRPGRGPAVRSGP